MKFPNSLCMLGALGLLAFPTAAQAQHKFDLEYHSAVPNIPFTFSGVLTTSNDLNSNVGGAGLTGVQIVGITGSRDGVSVSGLVPNPDFPLVIDVNSVALDNGLLTLPDLGFDNNGLSYLTTDGNEFNLFSSLSPAGGQYLEAENGSFDYIPVVIDLLQEEQPVGGQSVPDDGGTMAMLAAIAVGFLVVKTSRRQEQARFAL